MLVMYFTTDRHPFFKVFRGPRNLGLKNDDWVFEIETNCGKKNFLSGSLQV